ncbi:hypothetical protein ACFYTQ_21910 [Nocardia sp. NPDC004068]|uniref:hypothetical protein n=1 Tax=Nocardia sp. NPDC004068 TaxID=3364303 RepID=UPI003690837F
MNYPYGQPGYPPPAYPPQANHYPPQGFPAYPPPPRSPRSAAAIISGILAILVALITVFAAVQAFVLISDFDSSEFDYSGDILQQRVIAGVAIVLAMLWVTAAILLLNRRNGGRTLLNVLAPLELIGMGALCGPFAATWDARIAILAGAVLVALVVVLANTTSALRWVGIAPARQLQPSRQY